MREHDFVTRGSPAGFWTKDKSCGDLHAKVICRCVDKGVCTSPVHSYEWLRAPLICSLRHNHTSNSPTQRSARRHTHERTRSSRGNDLLQVPLSPMCPHSGTHLRRVSHSLFRESPSCKGTCMLSLRLEDDHSTVVHVQKHSHPTSLLRTPSMTNAQSQS